MSLRATPRDVGSVGVIDVSGNIILGESSASPRHMLRDLVAKGHRKIVLNLGDVAYIDSFGLGEFVSGFISMKKRRAS